jgi:hypothetical protein
MHVPCEVRDDLLQSVLITDNHTVTVDRSLLDFFFALFHRGHEGPSGNLSTIQG